jgi:hypothetical protein
MGRVGVGSEKLKVVRSVAARLPGLGASSPFSGHHSKRDPGFRRLLCATATLGKQASRRSARTFA